MWPRLSLRRSAPFALVVLHYRRLHPDGADDEFAQQGSVGTYLLEGVPLHHGEELRVADDARLYYLGQTRPELPVGEAGEQLGVAEDEFRLVEDSDDVLVSVEVHAVFAADARIDLCEEGSGQESETDAPHVGGGDKTGDVGHDAAAHTDDEGAPVGPHVEELAVDLFELDESLAAFALTDDDMFVRIDESQVVGMYLGVGHDDDAGRSAGQQALEVLLYGTYHDPGRGPFVAYDIDDILHM